MLLTIVLGYVIYFVFGIAVGIFLAAGVLAFAWSVNRDGVVNNIDEAIEEYNKRDQ